MEKTVEKQRDELRRREDELKKREEDYNKEKAAWHSTEKAIMDSLTKVDQVISLFNSNLIIVFHVRPW